MRTNSSIAVACLLSLFVFACVSIADKGSKDTPTTGNINIGTDAEFTQLTQAELTVFLSYYPKATIHLVSKAEDSLFYLLNSDSVRMIVSSRKLLASEEEQFKKQKLSPEQVKIGTDAVVLIVNGSNPDTLLSLVRIRALFNGKDSIWQQIDNSKKGDKINIVFDHENSGNARYILQNLISNHQFPKYCFALHGDKEVIEYVGSNANAIGIIGLNSLSNVYDPYVIGALKKIKIVALADKESTNAGDYYQPSIENLAAGLYPLSRDIYIINVEPYLGLGSGFLSFITCDKGQRVIYREGLLPARMPSHNIHF